VGFLILRGRSILLDLRIEYIKIWGGGRCEIFENLKGALSKNGLESLI